MKISYPKKQSEFEIHSRLFQKLLDNGFDAKGEVIHINSSAPKGFRKCRFDIVIFENKIATKIIEVKNHVKTNFDTRQDKKYSAFGIELIYCTSIEAVEDVIMYLKGAK